MERIKQLRTLNPQLKIFSVADSEFRDYGTVVLHDTAALSKELFEVIRERCPLDSTQVQYVPSISEAEVIPFSSLMSRISFGCMDIQIGCCWGKNHRLNGMEYHKTSELILPLDDVAIFMGRRQDIKENTWDTEKSVVFFVPAGTLIELYPTTLHLAPVSVYDEPFRAVIVLPRGTNQPLETTVQGSLGEQEQRLLLMRNKWMMAHPDSPAAARGADLGVTGENLELKPIC